MEELKLNLELECGEFGHYIVYRQVETYAYIDQVTYRFKFDNNYGASVIKGVGSFGYREDLWELAVISWMDNAFSLDYDTPIADDVIGYLTDEDVRGLLGQIKELPYMGD